MTATCQFSSHWKSLLVTIHVLLVLVNESFKLRFLYTFFCERQYKSWSISISEFKTINESGFVVVKIMMVGSTQ